jgi:hypothetical protein
MICYNTVDMFIEDAYKSVRTSCNNTKQENRAKAIQLHKLPNSAVVYNEQYYSTNPNSIKNGRPSHVGSH